MNIDDKVEQMVLERAMLIDRELYTLLKTYNIPFEGRVDELKKTLKEKGFEIIQEVNETPTATVYTLKICKLLGTRTLSIPKVVL